MSGEKANVDPYYEKAPKKRRMNIPYDPERIDEKGLKKPLELPPVRYCGPIKELAVNPDFFRELTKPRQKGGLWWYDCDTCGNIYLRRKRATGKFTFDSPECLKEHRQKLYSGLPIPEAQRRHYSKTQKEKYKDSAFSERMKKIHRDPQLNKQRSEAHKKRWMSKKRKRTNIDDQIAGFYISSDWRKQSKRILKRDGHTCQACGITKGRKTRLGAHHTYPLRNWIKDGHKPEEYPDDWLSTICGRCHPATDSQDGDFKQPRAPRS